MFSFTFDNINSLDVNLKVRESNHLSMPPRKHEVISVPGRTGNLILKDDSFENHTINILCTLDTRKTNDFELHCEAIGKWLQSSGGYKKLVFSDGSKFNAMCINQIEISKILKNVGSVNITFTAYKESNDK